MSLDELRYSLAEYTEKIFFFCWNLNLLIHPSITNYGDLLNKIEDDYHGR